MLQAAGASAAAECPEGLGGVLLGPVLQGQQTQYRAASMSSHQEVVGLGDLYSYSLQRLQPVTVIGFS